MAMQTDKASMLDEIIEYVKFLQLQVKVCSFSYRVSLGLCKMLTYPRVLVQGVDYCLVSVLQSWQVSCILLDTFSEPF